MIVDFKSLGHDFYGKVEQPVLTLKTPDGRIISTISNYYGLKPIFRFNDVSEVEFSVPAYFDGENNNGYSEIDGMRLVEVEPFGDFVLVNPVVNNEGGRKETKSCKAYSLEYQFNYKKAGIPAGTYNFHNPIDNNNTITKMIMEIMPDWSFGQIDRELIGRWRTFDNVDENLYAFMMNTLQESYNCLFLFDTINKKINVMSASRSSYNLPIYLSYNNLLKSVEITELSDEVVTALSGYGSGDGVDIRTVNPNGTNTIYNLDYFISKGDLPNKLARKWNTYKDTLELYGKAYSNLGILHIQKNNEVQLAQSKLIVLETNRDAAKEVYLTAQTQNDKNKDYNTEIDNLKTKWDDLEAEISNQKKVVETLTVDAEKISKQRSDIVSICRITSYFTNDEIKTLTPYFKQDSIVDDTFVVPQYSAMAMQDISNSLNPDNNARIEISGAEMYASNIAQIFTTDENGIYQAYTVDPENGQKIYNATDTNSFHGIQMPTDIAETIAKQLNDEAKKNVYEFRGGKFKLSYKGDESTNELSGSVVNVNFHYNKDNLITWKDDNSPETTKRGYFMLTATLQNAIYNGTSYVNMNVSLQGMLQSNIPQVGDDFVGFDISNAIIYVSAANTAYQKQAVLQELYDYTQECLEKLAFPSYEFSVNSGNFVFAKEFEPFKDKLELGYTINLALDDEENNIIQPILIEVGLNYDNEADFSIKFSNKYRSSSSEFQIADLITDMSRITQTSKLNSSDYSLYRDSGAGTQIDNFTNSALDVVKNKIINSANQSIEWDSTGMFFRRTLDSGRFDDKQIGIINDNIAFTKDNWNSVEIAIGAYEDSNVGEQYGIIAPAIIGTLLAGENLVIENEGKSFKFDGTGAWLHNSSLVFEQDADPNPGGHLGGKLLIDPRYGIAAGNDKLFKMEEDEATKEKKLVPSFIDDEGNIIWDESKVIINGSGQSQYYAPLNTQFFFDINTGDAYFGGTLNAENVVAGTLHGSAIKEGTLPMKSIDGLDPYLEQLDGRIQTYSQTTDPSIEWGSESDKEKHIGDVWLNTNTGITKIWNGSGWDVINDKELKELAESKARVFTMIPPAHPAPPYYKGDLWVQGASGDIYHCNNSRLEGEYSISDWSISSKYTNDDKANEAYTLADSAKGVAENAQLLGDKLKNCLGIKTTITDTSVIAPVIGGGHLLIGDEKGTYAQITKDGQLKCANADIAGTINAKNGYIGGFHIDNNNLTATGESTVELNSSGSLHIMGLSSVSDGEKNYYQQLDLYGGDAYFNARYENTLGAANNELPSTNINCTGIAFSGYNNSCWLFIDNVTEMIYGDIQNDSYINAGTNFYINNEYGLRGIKNGYGTASSNNSNLISWIGASDRVGLGSATNSAATEIRSPNNIYLKCGGTTADDAARTLVWNFADSDNVYLRAGRNNIANVGSPSFKWDNIYATNGTIQTSDKNQKRDIQKIEDKYLEMFDLLEPVSFKRIDGDRTHIGFVSQDVESAMNQVGLNAMDFAGFCKDVKEATNENGELSIVSDENGNLIEIYGLRYSEFIALNTAKIKQLEQLVLQLQAEINELKK